MSYREKELGHFCHQFGTLTYPIPFPSIPAKQKPFSRGESKYRMKPREKGEKSEKPKNTKYSKNQKLL